jgi:hypothetical protein
MPHVPRNRCCYPDANEISYLPSEAVDWIGNPGTVQIALDELSDRIHEIEINGGGGPVGDVDASVVTYTPSVSAASCWQGSSDPGNVDDALDQIVLRICDLEASLGSGVPTDASMITYAPSVLSLSCWQGSSDPGNVDDALDQIILRICDVEQCCELNTDLLDKVYFTHIQGSSSATWSVVHNLGRMPSVSVRDSSDVEIEGVVEHTDVDSLIIKFNKSITGAAYCV